MKALLTIEDIKLIFIRCSEIMNKNRQALLDLDAACGDGDLGLTMTKGFAAAAAAARNYSGNDAGKLFLAAGMAIAGSAPSTMGTLIASGFMRVGKEAAGREAMATVDCAAMMISFLDGIMARGKSKPGDKTIIDSLMPAAETLRQGENKPLAEAWADALEAAEQGVERARGMRAVHGRAAYYGDASIGKDDAGARVGMLIVKAFAEYVA
ncbi:MAG: dihydroxyacetone kinase subunit L [Candidatus Sumerlaeota bacterium]|nr:dihydroxyacetone kinase subunit L [Candidatus Sumerlaeota bacterium]